MRPRLFASFLVAGAACTALLASCNSEPPPQEGKVVDREYEPAHYESVAHTEYRSEVYTDTECSSEYDSYTKSYQQRCRPVTRTRDVPYTVYRDEWVRADYDLVLEVCKEDECKERTVDVSKSVYDDCAVGDYWRKKSACRHL